jgi:hypothetical protein
VRNPGLSAGVFFKLQSCGTTPLLPPPCVPFATSWQGLVSYVQVLHCTFTQDLAPAIAPGFSFWRFRRASMRIGDP